MPADSSSPTPSPDPSGPPAAPTSAQAGASPNNFTAEHVVPSHERHHVEERPVGKRLAVLTLAALGVVYGDIGTSPLYALRECFKPGYALTPEPDNIYGVASLIFWALMLVVTVKYVTFVMRADNRGEGGVLALLSLIVSKKTDRRRGRAFLIALGLFGAALLYGDGAITPAISVLSAMEGLEIVSPRMTAAVVPLTVGILIGLFLLQKRGTAAVGALFGPITLTWFVTIGALGLHEVWVEPEILLAVNPWYALNLFLTQSHMAIIVVGYVVLAVTGAEALYADMGHFGRRPIRVAWLWIVLPCLTLNYFGQGALLLRDPTAVENPFYLLAPRVILYPLIALATTAAVIASQAMISGAFSITQQCVQLGYSPRVTIKHTSAKTEGQIYIPEVNWGLMVGCLVIVLTFRGSSDLSAAYGIAVTGTMLATSVLFGVVTAARWNWPRWQVALLVGGFVLMDLALFGSNLAKLRHGGWVPVAIAIAIFIGMTTWKRGRDILRERLKEITMPLDAFLKSLSSGKILRVPGTAVFMTSEAAGAPVVLFHHLKHNKVLHEQVILLSIQTATVPEVPHQERMRLEYLEHGFVRVSAVYGFMETPNVTELLGLLRERGVKAKPMETSYYLGREQLIPRQKAWKEGGMTMSIWRKRLFAFMAKNAVSAAAFFQLPPNRVVELGTQIEF
ncbi:MAG: potassium transporter Kup [Gemmatimonadetes bacterium]|nr:potassium transporter Kup [Gemmatimonadota bacterium]